MKVLNRNGNSFHVAYYRKMGNIYKFLKNVFKFEYVYENIRIFQAYAEACMYAKVTTFNNRNLIS